MIGAQIPFSKKTAQRIFSLFDTEKYVPKSFKGLIPENVILARDNPTDGLHLIWSVGESGRTLYFSKSSGLATGRYPIPNLIFGYRRNVLQIFATNTKKIGRQSPLFHAPFLNVYTAGKICMGNVNVSGTERFENFDTTIEYLQNAFFNSVFTHSNNPVVDARSISETFEGRSFDTKKLVPIFNRNSKEQKTLNDLI
jgi:PRTRC genetic system protein B